MALVQSKYGKACPKCGSTKVLKPRLGYDVEGAQAKCQSCGFLIFKTNKKITLEAMGTLFLVVPLALTLNEQLTWASPTLITVAVLGLVMTFWSYRLPDSTEIIESSIHKLCSKFVGYGKYVVLALIAVSIAR